MNRERDSQQIVFTAVIEGFGPKLTGFVAYPGDAWTETEAFAIEVQCNGLPLGLRNLIPWKERGWYLPLSETELRKLGLGIGDRVNIEMRRARATGNTLNLESGKVSGWFWQIIERAGQNRERLRSILWEMSKEEIHCFQDEFLEAAAVLNDEPFSRFVNRDESEDGVDDISCWTVSQGRRFYTEVLKEPSRIPGHIEVGHPQNIFGVADEVYEAKFGKSIPM